MPPADFFDFFRASLASLAAEEPQAHHALALAMRRLRVRLIADGNARTVSFDGAAWVIDAASRADVSIQFDQAVVLDFIDGGLSIATALEQERLRIEGPVQSVERLNDVLLIYLEGMIRVLSASELLDEYRKIIYDPLS